MELTDQIKATDDAITDEQAGALAAFLKSEQEAWTVTVMPVVQTSDAERFTVEKLDTRKVYA